MEVIWESEGGKRGRGANMMRVALAGSMAGILAALTAAVSYMAIKFVPKSEPTVVLTIWFHSSALATAAVPLAVRSLETFLCSGCTLTQALTTI